MTVIIGFILGGVVVGFLYSKHEKKQRIYSYNAGQDDGFAKGITFAENVEKFNEDGE